MDSDDAEKSACKQETSPSSMDANYTDDLDIPMEGLGDEGDDHDGDDSLEFLCMWCDEVLPSQEALQEHIETHQGLDEASQSVAPDSLDQDEIGIRQVIDIDEICARKVQFNRPQRQSSTDEDYSRHLFDMDSPVGIERERNDGKRLAPHKIPGTLDEIDAELDVPEKMVIQPLEGSEVQPGPREVIGRILWPGHGQRPSKFIRISVRASMDDTCHFLQNVWKLPRAELLLYLIDVEPNSLMFDAVSSESKFVCDLHDLSKKTNILMTTTGQSAINWTLPGMVHYIKKRFEKNPHGLFSIAFPAWCQISAETQRLLQGNSTENNTVIDAALHRVDDSLGAAHDIYLLADDDSERVTSDSVLQRIILFRQRLEDRLIMKGDCQLPTVYLLAGGEEESWNYVLSALKKKIPVIVLTNSGGLADKLCRLRAAGALVEGTTVDEDGMLQKSLTLVDVPETVWDEFKDYHDASVLLKSFSYIQFYDPVDRRTDNLEGVLCEAMIQACQDEQLSRLLKKSHAKVTCLQQVDMGMDHSVLISPGVVTAVASAGVQHSEPAMRLLVQALTNNCPETVRTLLDLGLAFKTDFKQHHLAMLYAPVNERSILYKLAEKAGKNTEMGKFKISDSRLVVEYLLRGLNYPLLCGSGKEPDGCTYCRETSAAVEDAVSTAEQGLPVVNEKSCCMEPSLEVFLWALLLHRGSLAEIFWEMGRERSGSALIANALLLSMANELGDDDAIRETTELAQRFQVSAKGTLEMCFKMEEEKTHVLLTEQSQCWQETNILDLAYDLGNADIVALPACSAGLDDLWNGGIMEDTGILRILLFLIFPFFIPLLLKIDEEDLKRKATENKCKRETVFTCSSCCSTVPKCLLIEMFYTCPRVKFILAQVSTILFLILYAFVILFQISPQRFTVAEIVLCVWVVMQFVEEARQLACRGGGRGWWNLIKAYFKDVWNVIDFASLLVFSIGITLRCLGQKHWNQASNPDLVTEDMSVMFEWGHVFLSLDFILFLTRWLQVFCMHQKLGPMITMVFKMMQNLATFLSILILACVAYAVTSHAILYPNAQTDLSGKSLFKIPAMAYWNIFGDLGIVEVLNAKPVENGEATCSFNRSVIAQGALPACPSSLSRYLVPILLGFYLMVANVLLLNLLIAIFGNTYSSVQEKAMVYWRWQRCLVITEYQGRPLLPPPLNIISFLFNLHWRCRSGGCRRHACPCLRTNQPGQAGSGSAASLIPPGSPKKEMASMKPVFLWESRMSNEFIRVRKRQEEDNIVDAINDLIHGQTSMDSKLKTLGRDVSTIHSMAERLRKQEEAIRKLQESASRSEILQMDILRLLSDRGNVQNSRTMPS